MNTTNGKIAEQSREKFAKALLTIMQQYDFQNITVTQLSQEADLSRKTFYRLFKSKEELLNFYFESLYKECLSEIQMRNLHHYWDVVQCFFDFCEERKELLSLLKRHNLLVPLFEGVYRYSFRVFEYVRSPETVHVYSSQLPYLLGYSIGGISGMLVKWVENDMAVPSSELIVLLKNAFKSPEI